MIERLLLEAYGDEYEPPPPEYIKRIVESSNSKNRKTPNFNPVHEQRISIKPQSGRVSVNDNLIRPPQVLSTDQQSKGKTVLSLSQLMNIIRSRPELANAIRKRPGQSLKLTSDGQTHSLQLNTKGKTQTVKTVSLLPKLPTPVALTSTFRPQSNLQKIVAKNAIENRQEVQTPKFDSRPNGAPSPRPKGEPSPEELKNALVLHRENQPSIVIVDRRTKNKT